MRNASKMHASISPCNTNYAGLILYAFHRNTGWTWWFVTRFCWLPFGSSSSLPICHGHFLLPKQNCTDRGQPNSKSTKLSVKPQWSPCHTVHMTFPDPFSTRWRLCGRTTTKSSTSTMSPETDPGRSSCLVRKYFLLILRHIDIISICQLKCTACAYWPNVCR